MLKLCSTKNRTIVARTQGKGSPPVVFISGFPDSGTAWKTPVDIFSAVGEFTEVWNYDRPGTINVEEDRIEGLSDPTQQPVTAKDQVNDLHNIIMCSKIDKPFIIVAHSAGGLIARLYAYTYPCDVSGMILIDVTNEKLLETWGQTEIDIFLSSLEFLANERMLIYPDIEIIDFIKSFKQLNQYRKQKLYIPAIILSSTEVPDVDQLIEAGWPNYATQELVESTIRGAHESLDLLAKTFCPEAKRITVENSGHYIHRDHPNLIIKLIYNMVMKQRNC